MKDVTLKLPGLSGGAKFKARPSLETEGQGGQAKFPTVRQLQFEISCFHFLALHINFPQTLPHLQCSLRGQALFEKSVF